MRSLSRLHSDESLDGGPVLAVDQLGHRRLQCGGERGEAGDLRALSVFPMGDRREVDELAAAVDDARSKLLLGHIQLATPRTDERVHAGRLGFGLAAPLTHATKLEHTSSLVKAK